MSTISNVGAMRRLIVGMWTRRLATMQAHRNDERADRAGWLDSATNAYTEAAHIGLAALGCSVPLAPFGLTLIVIDAINAAGPMPAATETHALPLWREQLTDSIVSQITKEQ